MTLPAASKCTPSSPRPAMPVSCRTLPWTSDDHVSRGSARGQRVPLGRPDDPQRGHHGLRRAVRRLQPAAHRRRMGAEEHALLQPDCPGALIFSISQGLRTPVIDDIAFLGFERTLVGPVYPGDTIAARWT